MYLIINKTEQKTYKHEGSFPNLDDMLDKGDKVIVISLYSNTIKVPYLTELNGIREWEWTNYAFDPDLITQ